MMKKPGCKISGFFFEMSGIRRVQLIGQSPRDLKNTLQPILKSKKLKPIMNLSVCKKFINDVYLNDESDQKLISQLVEELSHDPIITFMKVYSLHQDSISELSRLKKQDEIKKALAEGILVGLSVAFNSENERFLSLIDRIQEVKPKKKKLKNHAAFYH